MDWVEPEIFLSDAARHPPPQCDAVITDPDYGLKTGHRGMRLGGSGAAFDNRVWAHITGNLIVGGTIAAFCSARAYHRMAMAIEGAGLSVVDQIAWLHSNGYPQKHGLKPAHDPICIAAKGKVQLPATFLSSGRRSPNVAVDEGAATILDAQTAHLGGGGAIRLRPDSRREYEAGTFGPKTLREWSPYPDSGGASRFYYCSKASPGERNVGDEKNPIPSVKPLDLMRWLIEIVCPPGGMIYDPFCGSGSTLIAAAQTGRMSIGVDVDQQAFEFAKRRIAAARGEVRSW